jgi:hypothetical protein
MSVYLTKRDLIEKGYGESEAEQVTRYLRRLIWSEAHQARNKTGRFVFELRFRLSDVIDLAVHRVTKRDPRTKPEIWQKLLNALKETV